MSVTRRPYPQRPYGLQRRWRPMAALPEPEDPPSFLRVVAEMAALLFVLLVFCLLLATIAAAQS